MKHQNLLYPVLSYQNVPVSTVPFFFFLNIFLKLSVYFRVIHFYCCAKLLSTEREILMSNLVLKQVNLAKHFFLKILKFSCKMILSHNVLCPACHIRFLMATQFCGAYFHLARPLTISLFLVSSSKSRTHRNPFLNLY